MRTLSKYSRPMACLLHALCMCARKIVLTSYSKMKNSMILPNKKKKNWCFYPYTIFDFHSLESDFWLYLFQSKIILVNRVMLWNLFIEVLFASHLLRLSCSSICLYISFILLISWQGFFLVRYLELQRSTGKLNLIMIMSLLSHLLMIIYGSGTTRFVCSNLHLCDLDSRCNSNCMFYILGKIRRHWNKLKRLCCLRPIYLIKRMHV